MVYSEKKLFTSLTPWGKRCVLLRDFQTSTMELFWENKFIKKFHHICLQGPEYVSG